MNRNKRVKLVGQRKEADDICKAKLNKLHGQGFHSDQDTTFETVSKQETQDLLRYVRSLEKRIEALETALNLNIDSK